MNYQRILATLLLVALLSSCVPAATETAPLPKATSTLAQPTKTLVPTPTIIPTPVGGGGTLAFAYLTQKNNTATIVHIVLLSKTLEISIDSQYVGSVTPNISFFPDMSMLAVQIGRGNFTDVVVSMSVPENGDAPVLLRTLPENSFLNNMGFSRSGKWLFLEYNKNSRSFSVDLIEMSSGKFVPLYDCHGFIAFSVDETQVYCRKNSDVIQINPITASVQPFMQLPERKMYDINKISWQASNFIPSLDSFILMSWQPEQLILASQMTERGNKTNWSRDELRTLLAEPLLVDFSQALTQFPTALPFQFIPSPDGRLLAVTGINDRGLGIGPCIDPDTFTFVTAMNETFTPQSVAEFGPPFYALAWSPDGRSLLGVTGDSTDCRLSLFDAKTMREV